MEENKRNDSKIPEKRVEKVISGTAKTKKKSDIQKFTDVFLADDIASVKEYAVKDVVIPTIQKGIVDIVQNGIEMLIYGATGATPRRSSSTASKVSYRSYYDKRDDRERDRRSVSRARSTYSYDDIILDRRGEAEEVLDRMYETVERYGMVSVGDLYDLVGITGDYTAHRYGWANLDSAYVKRIREGYTIVLPKAMPFD